MNAHPLICPGCGYDWPDCPFCEERFAVFPKDHEGPLDKRLIRRFSMGSYYVLNGKSWSGCDFCRTGAHIITHRAPTWFQQVHAVPFLYKPCPVVVDGMSKEQLEKLEKARRPYGAS